MNRLSEKVAENYERPVRGEISTFPSGTSKSHKMDLRKMRKGHYRSRKFTGILHRKKPIYIRRKKRDGQKISGRRRRWGRKV